MVQDALVRDPGDRKVLIRVLSIFGTRPEAIKMAPVIRELRARPDRIESIVCVTAQHRSMLDQVLELFGIVPDMDLDLMEENQSLELLTARSLSRLAEVLEKVKPDLILVQGDTTTAMTAGLAAFYRQIAVGHVEAGLRTQSRYRPFPEEMNRRLLGTLATYHFAPTERAGAVLRGEGVPGDSVFVTGNPVIDALQWVARQSPTPEATGLLGAVGATPLRTLLVTVHRRETFGSPLRAICESLWSLVKRNPDIQVVYPVHRNPNVRSIVLEMLTGEPRIQLTDPLPYATLVHVMAGAYLVLTDSGGLQEEAPALGKPVLVLRTETERVEGVEAGVARLVGTDPVTIVAETERVLRQPDVYRQMACAVSPYGDGHAAERIVGIILDRVHAATRSRPPAP